VALLTFPPNPNNGDKYPVTPLPGQPQYQWSSADSTWRLLGPATGVIPGCYGDPLNIPVVCYDYQGRATSATVIPFSAVTRVDTGTGLLGGPVTTTGTISLDTAYTDGRYLRLTGGTMTGDITFSGTQIFPVSGIQDATTAQKGVVQIGANIDVVAGVISVPVGTTTTLGVLQLATDAETQAGTDTTKALTPSNLSSRTATETRTGIAEISTQAETETGTDDATIVTPLKLRTATVYKSDYNAKGDILSATANDSPSVLSVGANSQVLKADSTTLTGLAWGYLQFVSYDDISAGFDGLVTAFPLTVGGTATPPAPSTNIMVYVGGVIQIPGSSYTVSGSTITFLSAPPASASFYAVTIA